MGGLVKVKKSSDGFSKGSKKTLKQSRISKKVKVNVEGAEKKLKNLEVTNKHVAKNENTIVKKTGGFSTKEVKPKLKTLDKSNVSKKIKVEIEETKKSLKNVPVTHEHVAKRMDAITKKAVDSSTEVPKRKLKRTFSQSRTPRNIKVEVEETTESSEQSADAIVKSERILNKTRKQSETSKEIKIEVNGTEKTVGNLEITNEHVAKCVDAILQLTESHAKKKNLLLSDNVKIFLQITCIKVPKVPQRNLRLVLPHSIAGPLDDVALIVADNSKGLRQDYEKTIDHWETKLRQSGVTRIKDILPLNKIKTEYSQYEMRRKLARLYDFFLIDGRIVGHATHCLGTTFTRFAMPPVPIRFGGNLKRAVEIGLKKSYLRIHSKGNSHSVQVAASHMSKDKIVENIIATCEEIRKKYPGGFENIRTILVKAQSTLAIPIYFSIKSRNKVKVPVIASKRPKAYKTVEGELTTIEKDVNVRVSPGGHIKLVLQDGSTLKDEETVPDLKKRKLLQRKKIVKNNRKLIKKEKVVKEEKE